MKYYYKYKISFIDNFYEKYFKNKLDNKIKYLSKIKPLQSTYFILALFKKTRCIEYPHKMSI